MSEWYGATDWDESVATIHRALDLRRDVPGHRGRLWGRAQSRYSSAGPSTTGAGEVQLATKFGIDRTGGDDKRVIRGERGYVRRSVASRRCCGWAWT